MVFDLFTRQQARDIIGMAKLTGTPVVTLVKRTNHVYRLEGGTETFFLKLYTKDWYGEPASTGFCVDHEASAWRTLTAHGLTTPEVVLEAQDNDNPLQRPFLLTRALPGKPLTDLLHQAGPVEFQELLERVGEYLRRMHSIRFPFSGYITSAGLNAPPAPERWQHFIWTFTQFTQEARSVWKEDQAVVPVALGQRIEAFFAQYAPQLEAIYQIPRFTHGDCHPHQFFLYRVNDSWRVSGLVDMEVASAGDTGADWVKMVLELAGTFSSATAWWKSLFTGYGEELDFELLKLRLLAAGHINYTCLGERSWPGTRAQILAHVLEASSWGELFDTTHIVRSVTGRKL
jgi:aminoglycoside phosphotransferase